MNQTREHVRRLEQILEAHGERAGGVTCKGMQGLIQEGEEMARKRGADAAAKDAGLIAAAQRVEHYEIAGYGTVCTDAKEMGHTRDLDLLKQTLSEEKMTDEQLTTFAEGHLNRQANR